MKPITFKTQAAGRVRSPLCRSMCILVASVLAACSHAPSWTPASGPHAAQIVNARAHAETPALRVVTLDAITAHELATRSRNSLAASLGRAVQSSASTEVDPTTLGKGDRVEISVWEAPPALLFGGGVSDARGPVSGRALALPDQAVDSAGEITVPFAGRLKAAGLSPGQLQEQIERRLAGIANRPQALVRVTQSASSLVTVVGEVASSVRMPLTARGERLLDALAAAGGVRHPVTKVSVQLTRGQQVHMLPLDGLIRDPRQNVPLQPGDVVTALAQPLSFTVLGATGRNDEIAFEAQGITLAQALARAGGLNDNRADVKGVFVFRLESPASGDGSPAAVENTTPVVYTLDLRDPAGFFIAQSFEVAHRDLIYVSNAPGAELQKFLSLLWGAALPAMSIVNVTR